jgi:hypothetical protein
MSADSTQTLIELLRQVHQILARTDNDLVWSHWDSRDDALRQFDELTGQIKAGDTSRKKELERLFAPTGPIQEVSISSGWGEEFLS